MSPDTMPLVSVIIPVYNGSRWIGDALRSVFAQTYPAYEVIVVDDGSTDAVVEALGQWSDRIVFVQQANRGPASARNRGIGLAKGRLVAFLDADDEWLPDKLALQVAYFDRYPQTGLLHTAVADRPGDTHTAAGELGDPPRNVFCTLFHTESFIRTLTVMAPRSALLEVGGFDERREIHVEDWDLWLRVAARHPVGYLPRPLAVHRQGGHMSMAVERTYAGQALVIEKHRALCQIACAKHRAAPARCLRDRQFVMYRSWASERFRRSDRAGARHAFARAIALRPWRLATYARYAACFVSERWTGRLRALRRRFGRMGQDGPRLSAAAAPSERATVVHDTVYRRARRRVARFAHRTDEAITRAVRSRRRILFEAASPMSFGLFQPVYRHLRADPRLEFWFTAPGRAWRSDVIFSAVGITERVIPADRAIWDKWDVCVNTDFWEMTRLRRCTRRVHLFHGVAGKYRLDAPVDLAPEIACFASLMFPNEDRLRRYVDAGLVAANGRSAALVGYPKADALVDGSLDRGAICARLRLRPERPTVVYAPTWSPHSSLNTMGERIINGLAAAGYQVIVKLHDRSYDRLPRGSGGIDWAQRLTEYRNHPLVRVVHEADACPFLFVADALVTDHSSIGFEFMLLDRPLVVVDCPDLLERAHVSPDKVRVLRAGADLVGTATDVPDAVTAALARPWRHSRARRETADAMFYRAGTATGRAVALMYELLDLPAPVPEEAASPDTVFVSATSS